MAPRLAQAGQALDLVQEHREPPGHGKDLPGYGAREAVRKVQGAEDESPVQILLQWRSEPHGDRALAAAVLIKWYTALDDTSHRSKMHRKKLHRHPKYAFRLLDG